MTNPDCIDPNGFRTFIRARRVTDTPRGDFIADAKADRHFPDARSWAQLACYLVHRHACHGAINAARRVWNAYARQCARKP